MPPIPGTGTSPTGTDPNNPYMTGQNTFYASNQQGQGNSAQAQAQTGSQLNQYTAGQQQLQSQLPQLLSGVLSGQAQIPPYWTAPQQVFDAYNHNFQHYTAPQIAAQYGAGSPQMGSQMSLGNERLAAELYQGGIGNYLNFLNQAGTMAFTPVGQQTAAAQNQNNNWQSQQNTLGYQGPSILAAGGTSLMSQLLGGLG